MTPTTTTQPPGKNRLIRRKLIPILFITFILCLSSCYEFDFVIQPLTTDSNSSFDVEICVNNTIVEDSTEVYFGILMPIGWTTNDSVGYICASGNTFEPEVIIYSENLVQQMTSFDPPPENYRWWVGSTGSIYPEEFDSIYIDFSIHTDNQNGNFFLDYMLGDGENGMNLRRSNNHLIIVGEPMGDFPEGITFNTQAEINNFQSNYPNCTEIAGNITIDGSISDINSLEGLDVLTSIGGHFTIENTSSLTNLEGMENLTGIGGTFKLSTNNILSNFSGLSSLDSIGRDLIIEGNSNLTSLSGLENLNALGKNLVVYYNSILTNLNGLDNMTSIGGCLDITNNDSLVNLSGLENLTSIASGIIINDNPSLTSLAELSNISSNLGWNLSIQHNIEMTSLSGLENITSIGGKLLLVYSSGLTDLSGLNNLTSVGQNLEMYGNHNMTSLSGLESLETIGGDLKFWKKMGPPWSIVGNLALSDLTALANLVSIGGSLEIVSQYSLTSLEGLENIDAESINELKITNNPLLSNCAINSICDYIISPGSTVEITYNATGCSDQQEVEDSCEVMHCLPEGITFSTQAEVDSFQVNYPGCDEIQGNVIISGEDIENLSGLNVLTSIWGNFMIGGPGNNHNPMLNNLTGLDNLNSVGGDFHIITNTGLTSLTGLESLSVVEGELSIGTHFPGNGNSLLPDLTGLNNLTSIGGVLSIIANGSLTNISALSNLTSLGGSLIIGSDMENVFSNGLLTNLEGLEGLTIIHGDVAIIRNGYLIDLTGLHNITSIEGSVSIYNNSIDSLTGLNNLISMGGVLQIAHNISLTSLTGLENISESSITDLYVTNNESLSHCAVLSVCNYLASPNGDIVIQNNASGCLSQEEVIDICINSVDEHISEDKIIIYPNPCSGSTNLRISNKEQGTTILEVFGISGRKIMEVLNEELLPGTYEVEVDFRDLPAGVYYCVLRTGSGSTTNKLIKL